MKFTKFILIAAGVVGIIACFLPYFSFDGHSMSLWDGHSHKQGATEGLLNGPKQAYVDFLGFGLAAVMGVLGMKKLLRWQGIVGAVGGLIALACETTRKGFSTWEHIGKPAIGGKLLLVAALAAVVGGILGAAKPED